MRGGSAFLSPITCILRNGATWVKSAADQPKAEESQLGYRDKLSSRSEKTPPFMPKTSMFWESSRDCSVLARHDTNPSNLTAKFHMMFLLANLSPAGKRCLTA